MCKGRARKDADSRNELLVLGVVMGLRTELFIGIHGLVAQMEIERFSVSVNVDDPTLHSISSHLRF